MPSLRSRLAEFFTVLFHDWVALVSGIAGIVFSVWATLFSPSNAAVRQALWITFVLCLFLAAYRVWSVEHKKYLAECEKSLKPRLEGEIQDYVLMPLSADNLGQEKTLGVWLRVYIFNPSSCETGIKNFRWHFTVGDRKTEAFYPEEQRIIQVPQRPMQWEKQKVFYNLVDFVRSGNTLRQGQHVVGYLCFYCPEFKDDLDEVVKDFVLTVTDSWGQDWPLARKRVPVLPSERLFTS